MPKKYLLWEIELHYKQLSWTVQKQPSTAIHFGKFLQKLLVLESFFYSNYRLTVQSSDYILKWFHQECFLGNLPLGLFRCSRAYPSILENFSKKTPVVESVFCSNYRQTMQSGDYMLKWVHQECFLGNIPKASGAPKYQIVNIWGKFILSSKKWHLVDEANFHETNLSLTHIFFS